MQSPPYNAVLILGATSYMQSSKNVQYEEFFFFHFILLV